MRGRRPEAELAGEVDLLAVAIGVGSAGTDGSVAVERLDDAEVHDAEVFDAGCGKPDGDIEPDAPKADDEASQAIEIGLLRFAPCRDGADLAGLWEWDGSLIVVPGDLQVSADDPYGLGCSGFPAVVPGSGGPGSAHC